MKLNVLLLGAAALMTFATSAFSQTKFTQTTVFNIPEANQGVAVDKDFFYAIDNATVAKYTKGGQFVTKWVGDPTGPIIHLDSGVVVNDKLYAAHSSYRRFPLTSSIEVWETRTLKHIGSHSIGISLGSLTWLNPHDGSWHGAFANYDKTGQMPDGTSTSLPYASVPQLGNISSTIVKFNADWQVVEGWIFPSDLLVSFGDMSNSGGSWGPDGRLYITGHDNTEVYKIRFPEAGSVLEVEEDHPGDRSRAGHRLGSVPARHVLRHHPRHRLGDEPGHHQQGRRLPDERPEARPQGLAQGRVSFQALKRAGRGRGLNGVGGSAVPPPQTLQALALLGRRRSRGGGPPAANRSSARRRATALHRTRRMRLIRV